MREVDLPDPQVVQVISRDGEAEVRLASLDRMDNLVLHQVDLSSDGDVQVGGNVKIHLSSIGSVGQQGKAVMLNAAAPAGQVGRTLLELRFEGPQLAAQWAQLLRGGKSAVAAGGADAGAAERSKAAPLANGGGGGDAGGAASGPATATQGSAGAGVASVEAERAHMLATLGKLVEQQEEQARLLDELNNRKGEQLVQLQERLESALEMLQQGQVSYSAQARIVAEQQEIISGLQNRLRAASIAEMNCLAAESEANVGRAAAQAAQAARAAQEEEEEGEEADEDEDEEEGGEDEEDDDEDEGAPEEMLERLRALQTQKSQFEAELREQHEAMAQTMRHLTSMMPGLEAMGGLGGAGGELDPAMLVAMLSAFGGGDDS